MSLMAFVKFGYALVVVTLLLMIWASISRAELHVDTGHPPCLFQALCTCSKPAGDLGTVTCANVPVYRVPAAVNSSKVFTLLLHGNGIRDLEPQFFQATGLYRLVISQNPLEEINDEAFYGLDNTLWELVLSQDLLTAVPSRAIRYLQKLRLLDLSGNEISDVSGDNWRGLEHSLETLILSDNSIANLPLDAFTGLPNLETLDLSGNHLAIIDNGVFRDGMHKLNRLYLQDNQLTFIPYEEISPLRALRILDLSRNVIKQVTPARELPNGIRLSLDTLKLDNNVIRFLLPGSFKYFNVLNYTSMDGNPMFEIREDAFRNAKIKGLSLRDCGLVEISPAAFAGLETSLQSLDLSQNNLSMIASFMINKLDALRSLNLKENRVDINLLASSGPQYTSGDYNTLSPYNTNNQYGNQYSNQYSNQYGNQYGNQYSNQYNNYGSNSGYNTVNNNYNNFQYKLFYLDISGDASVEMTMQDVRRMRSLRYLSVGRLLRRTLRAEDFLEYGVEIEDLKITGSTITGIETSAFEHVRTIKTLDLSDNRIEFIDPYAFAELHSLTTLKLVNGLADNVKILPFEPMKALIELQYLDISNNKLKNVPDTSFHFMYKLKQLNLQDNGIEYFSKGTLQGDIHKELESISLSFNQLHQIDQHTFVDLKELQRIHLEKNQLDIIHRRAFTSLDNLKFIKLRGNRISEISDEAFQNLPALKELDISFNWLYTFRFSMFDQVGSATALKVNASYNHLTALTDSNAPSFYTANLYPLPNAQSLGTVSVNIRVLDFSHNNITFIAPYFFRHADLTLSELHLHHNKLTNITREVFGSMLMLQYLDLSNNYVFHLEYDCFKKVKNLQILKLSHNYIYEVPLDLFRDMQFLTYVDLSHNRIRNLPDNLILSPALERLDLSSNDLSRVPTNSISPAAASNLVELDLSGNIIPAVSTSDFTLRYRNGDPNGELYLQEENDYGDEYMYHTARRDRVYHQKKPYPQNILYKSLAWLDLSNNHLVRIEGGTFGALPRLKWLDLSDNAPFTGDRHLNVFRGLERRLTYLGIKNVSLITIPAMPLPKLRTLVMSFNNLPSIPPDATANLTRLRQLDLSFNDLTTVPVSTHTLNDLRWLSLAGNPISAFMNTSLYGISSKIEYLDVSQVKIKILEQGVFNKMYALRTLKISVYETIRDYNVPQMLTHNPSMKNLFLRIEDSSINLGKEMSGSLPCKLNNITVTGKAFKFISEYFLSGVHSKDLHLTIFNTTVEEIDGGVFWRPGRVRNITLDLRNNYITRVPNPGRSEWPGVPNTVFLQDILLAENPLICDCGIGWVEAWDRKRRQYLCKDPGSCVQTRDDPEFARCLSWENRTLSDVLTRDLDCGWSSGFLFSPNLLIIVGMTLLTSLYI